MERKKDLQLGRLIKRIAKGNQDAIVEIARLNGKVMYSVAYSYAHNAQDTADIMQAAYFTIVQKAHMFRKNQNAYSWLNTVVQNIARNTVIKRNRNFALSIEEYAFPVNIEEDLHDKVLLDELLDRLTDEERMLVSCRYFGEMPYAEMSRALGVPATTLQYRVTKVVEKLQNWAKKD